MSVDLDDGRDALQRRALIPQVSLLVEALQVSPRLVFWTATLAQAVLWVLVPALFYFAPPDGLAEVLAVGHQWHFGVTRGPPLAYLLADGVFHLTGPRMIGLYLLSQLCIVLTYWAVFALARPIVGARQAVMAVLLMVGIYPFAVPTPEFGPHVLAMPLSALALLSYWRAVGERRRPYWPALAVALGLLVLTSYAGLILIGVMVLFTAATAEGRAAGKTVDALLAVLTTALIVGPYLIWIDRAYAGVPALTIGSLPRWAWLLAIPIVAHAGLLLLAGVAAGAGADRMAVPPVIVRPPVGTFSRRFVYVFALAPVLVAATATAVLSLELSLGDIGPHVVLSGVAVVVAAGDAIRLHRQHVLGVAWLALLIAPPVLAVAAVLLLPWTFAVALNVNEPAAAMGRFFTESFQRRTGRPLRIVAGDVHLASLVALASPDRPRVSFETGQARGAPASDAEIQENGAIVLWPLTTASAAPPTAMRQRFPGLVAEVPQTFERPIQGFLPPLRIGWGVLRPQVEGGRQRTDDRGQMSR